MFNYFNIINYNFLIFHIYNFLILKISKFLITHIIFWSSKNFFLKLQVLNFQFNLVAQSQSSQDYFALQLIVYTIF